MDKIIEILASNAGSATAMALVAAGLSRFVRRPAILHVMWLLVLLRLFAPPVVEVPLLPATDAGVTLPSYAAASSVGGADVDGAAGSFDRPVSASTVAWWLWFVGAGILAVLSIVRTSRVRKIIQGGTPTPWSLSTRIEKLSAGMGIRNPPATTIVDAIVPPMLWGPLGALRLVLPSRLLEQLNDSEQDTLIAHELAHVRRRDHLVRHLELAAMVVFWWLPVTWWARRRLRSAEERCCDGLVIRSLPGHGRAYADCLVKTMDFLSTRRMQESAVCSGIGGLSEMKGRIRMIMANPTPPTTPPVARALLVSAAVATLAVFPSLSARRATADPASGGTSIAATGDQISLTLEQANLRDVLTQFAVVSGLNFVVDPGALPTVDGATATVHVTSTPWDQVLDQILAANGLSHTLEGNVLWIHQPGVSLGGDREFNGEPINLNLSQARLSDVLSTFEKLVDRPIDADPGVEGEVTVAIAGVPWDQALDLILRINGCGWSSDGHRLHVFRTTGALGEQLAVPGVAAGKMSGSRSPASGDPEVIGTLDGRPLYRYREGGRMTAPQRISGTDPQYPPASRSVGLQGEVVIEAVIDTAGSVRDAFAIRSPSDELAVAAVDAITTWRFEPATLDGEAVPVHYFLTVRFSLE